MPGERFFNDDPVDGSADAPDLLGRQQYARHAVELLHQVREQSESGVLALIGPWGSGKSSVLQMTIEHLKNAVVGAGTRVWSVAELNPWIYSDLESLTLALFSEIRAALPDDGQWSELRRKVGAFGQAVSPLGKLTGLLGLDSSELIKLVAERVTGDTSASASKRTAETALRQAGLPVLVIMDDLDRLAPEELLVVFKLIRLVGHLPNVYYLISFDEQTLLDVLQRTDLVGSNDQRAQEFLEKLIQVRLDLPAFRDRDIAAMTTRLLNALLDSHQVSMTPDQERRFSEAYFRHLQDRLRTPRAIKRYFGQAGATLGSLVGEVDIVDFLAVTFLRTSEPGVYRMLGRHRAELTGTSIDPALHRNSRPGEHAERWKERLRQAGVAQDNLDGMLALLALLFPAIQQSIGNGSDPRIAARRRGIGSQDYFDRYVVFTVPADDLPEAVFQQALAQMASGTEGDEAAQLLLRLRDDTHRIIRRIDQLRADGIPIPAAALLQAMADNYGQLTAQPEAMGLLGADRRVRSFTPSLLLDLPPEERPSAVAAMATTPDGAVLATRTLHSATNPDDTASEHTTTTEPWAEQARDALTGRLAEHLAPAAQRPAPDLTDQDSTLIWMWRHTDPAGIRTWLHDRLDHGWELLPLLATLITPQQFPFPLIDNDTWAGLDALFTHNDLYTRLTPSSTTPPTPQPPPTNTRPTSSKHSATADPADPRQLSKVAAVQRQMLAGRPYFVVKCPMGSRTKRRKARNKRHRRSVPETLVLDPHAQVIADSLTTMTTLMASFTGDDPASEADTALAAAIEEFVVEVQRFDAMRLIEVARQRFLPMAHEGEMPVTAEAGAVYVELLALFALTARQEAGTTAGPEAGFQEMSHFVSSAKEGLSKVLYLAQLRSFARADPTDKLAMVSLLIRGAEVWMRNPSYPEMVEETNLALLDGVESVRAALQAELGFDAADAIAVLNACHDLQQDRLNDRIEAMGNAVLNAMAAEDEGRADRQLTEQAMLSVTSMFEPPAEQATVTIDDIVAHTSLLEECVRAVVERFRLDLGTDSPMDVVEAFTSGRNPLRTRPLIVGADGRLMLPHPALNVFAVRENLEEHLKKTAPVWSQYAKHRGDLLESRTHAALERVLPGARFRGGLEYYLPASDDEAEAADPSKYTKRAEGDHLIVLDDVAIIVEDKAVALSALSRGGKAARIRTDLTGIITKAAEQAGRMRDAIERDGGLRTKNEGWIDLSQIREIHTIAVSLDDISTVLTATAELVRAGLLAEGNIPWTVSLHDLELITELVARPAEFLLYLRRRRNPDVTVMFHAPDEMDLFLYFFEAGLWVEPDPVQVRAAFPFLPEPATAELRRYRTRKPAFLTSRTDALDQWFHTQVRDGARSALAPKPAMVPSPLAPLVDELQSRNVTGWLSIGATLLSGATDMQHKFSRYGDALLDSPSPKGRSLTVPLTASVDPAEGWLFVWATRPAEADPNETDGRLRNFLRAKMHQLDLPRGVVFLYDQPTRKLLDICYNGHTGPLDAALTASLSTLRPPSELHRSIHPNAKRPQGGTRNAARHKRKR